MLSRALTAMLMTAVAPLTVAQDSLCNPCVDPPTIRLNNLPSPNATTIVTADDMRALGVIRAADLVRLLPNGLAGECRSTRSTDGLNLTPNSGGSAWHGTPALAVLLPDRPVSPRTGYRLNWYSENIDTGESVQVDARNLFDSSGAPSGRLLVEADFETIDDHWQASTTLRFPESGCWLLSAFVRDRSLSLTIEVVD